MTSFSRIILPVVMLGSAAALSGCGTMGSTVSSMRESLAAIELPKLGLRKQEDAAGGDTVLVASQPVDCPRVGVVDDLNSITQFADENNTQSVLSQARLVNIHSSCAINENNVIVDMDITIESRIGPRGRVKEGDKPAFSYPYFVAITTPQGDITAKEIFTATIAFDGEAQAMGHAEQLRQVIPLRGDYNARDYEILAGFQLSPVALDYNRRQAAGGQAPAPTNIQTMSPAEIAEATARAQAEAKAAQEKQAAFEAEMRARAAERRIAAESRNVESRPSEALAADSPAAEKAVDETAILSSPDNATQTMPPPAAELPNVTAKEDMSGEFIPATIVDGNDATGTPQPPVTTTSPLAPDRDSVRARSLRGDIESLPEELRDQVRSVTPAVNMPAPAPVAVPAVPLMENKPAADVPVQPPVIAEPTVTPVAPLYPVTPGKAPPPPQRIIPRVE